MVHWSHKPISQEESPSALPLVRIINRHLFSYPLPVVRYIRLYSPRVVLLTLNYTDRNVFNRGTEYRTTFFPDSLDSNEEDPLVLHSFIPFPSDSANFFFFSLFFSPDWKTARFTSLIGFPFIHNKTGIPFPPLPIIPRPTNKQAIPKYTKIY